MKHIIKKAENIMHGTIGWMHEGNDGQYCEAGEVVKLTWQPSAGWGLQEAHYIDADGNIVPIMGGEFVMPDSAIFIGATFKRFVIEDWTDDGAIEGNLASIGAHGTVVDSGIPVSDLATKAEISEINPFKGWFANTTDLNTAYPTPSVGDYAYVKGAESTDPAAIYECTTAGSWSDSGRTADTSNVQTFASGEEVNEVGIDNIPIYGSDNVVKSGGVFPMYADMYGASSSTTETITLTKLGTADKLRILVSTGAASDQSTFAINVYTITQGKQYTIHVPLSGSSGVYTLAYSDLTTVGSKSSYSNSHVFPITTAVGNSGEQTLTIDSALNYATLLVSYVSASGEPTVTTTETVTTTLPVVVVKTTEQTFSNEEKVQARQNIGAAEASVQTDLIRKTTAVTKGIADFTLTGHWDNSSPTLSTGDSYISLPLQNVTTGEVIKFKNWKTGSSLSSVGICWFYDEDDNPYNGSYARFNYSDAAVIDYTNGEYTVIVPGNAKKLGVSISPTYSENAHVIIGEKSYYLTEEGHALLENATMYFNGDTSANYYLKGNSVIPNNNKKLGIITAGQSNAAGRNSYSDLPSGFVNPNNKVHFCNNTSGTFSSFEVVDGGEGNDWGFDAIVYDYLTKADYGNQSDIYVMKKAMGGTSIDIDGATDYHWTADYEYISPQSHSLLREFEAIIRAGIASQGNNFEIKAFCWHQGEGDSHTKAVADRYYNNLKNMLAYIKGVIGNPRLHFFCGTISRKNVSDPYTSIVNAAYWKIASEDPYFHCIDMSNAELEDKWHFNYQWSIYFGQKVYDAMIDAGIVNGTKINPSEPT